jgi:hypothetical protein
MTFLHFVRRTHLYLGLALLPWVIMFGVTSIPINHPAAPNPPTWNRIGEVAFDAPLPAPGEDLRALGRQMMTAGGVAGGFYVNRANPQQVNVNHPNFMHPVRMMYYADRQQLVIERRDFSMRPFLGSLHTRGGYRQEGLWDTVWAVLVDVVSIGLLLWILSGLIMWWNLPATRAWGWLALGGGAASFLLIIWKL